MIVQICCKYIEAIQPSAKEKELVVLIIQDLLVQDALIDVDIDKLLVDILTVLNFQKLTSKCEFKNLYLFL